MNKESLTTFVYTFLKLQQLLQHKVNCLSTAVRQKAKEKTCGNDICQPDCRDRASLSSVERNKKSTDS